MEGSVIDNIITVFDSATNNANGSILFHITVNSATSILNDMATMLASILAIILGFSMVAIQLSKEIGGPRIIDLILKDDKYRYVLSVYVISILLDLTLLRILPESDIDIWITIWINISIILTTICLILIPKYAKHTIERLRPEKIIQEIIKNKTDDIEQIKYDTISPIIFIVNKALNEYDVHTLKFGTAELKNLVISIIDSKKDSEYKIEIVRYYISKASKLIDASIEKNDEQSVIEIINSIRDIGMESIKMRWSELPSDIIKKERIKKVQPYREMASKTDNYDMMTLEIKSFFSDICNKIIDKKWNKATRSLLFARGNLMIASIVERVSGIPEINPIRDELQFVCDFENLPIEGKIFSSCYFTEALSQIVRTMIKNDILFYKKCYDGTIIHLLIKLGKIEKDHHLSIAHVIHIGIEASKKKHKFMDNIKNILVHEEFLKRFDVTQGFIDQGLFANNLEKNEIIWILSCLKEIGNVYISKENNVECINIIFNSLATIENIYRQTKSSDVPQITEKIIEIIEELTYNIADSNLEEFSREIIDSMIKIYMMNEDKTIKSRICKILKYMKEKLSKEIVDPVIKSNEESYKDELIKFRDLINLCIGPIESRHNI